MRKLTFVALLMLLATINAAAQDPKPWTEWSKTEAERMLNDSPWGQTQVYKRSVVTSNSASPSSTAATPPTGIYGPAGTNAVDDGNAIKSVLTGRDRMPSRPATTSSGFTVTYTYRIRFLSAKPIREAFAATLLIRQAGFNPADGQAAESLKGRMQEFVDRNYGDFIVVTVTYDAGTLTGKAFQDFDSAATDTLKNNTYLERKDGKRAYLIDYRSQIDDGLGAKFVFPRTIDGKPFLAADSGQVRFYAEIGTNLKLNRHFKISEMIYQGKLEY